MTLPNAALRKVEKLSSFFKNKTIVVTGATSGIGQSTALMLSRMGANVVILSRTPGDLEKTMRALEEAKAHSEQKFKSYPIDLRQVESVVRTSALITSEHKVDILVNNAGVYFTNYFENQSHDQIQSMILTNFLAPLQLTRAFIPHFLKNGGGQVVNVSSIAAKVNFTGYGVYGGTKAGLAHSSIGLQFEYGPKKIFFTDFFAPDSFTRGYQEELKTMPAETKKINGTVKPLSSDDVALSLLQGIASRKLQIVPGAKNKALMFLAKHLPTSWILGILRLLSK